MSLPQDVLAIIRGLQAIAEAGMKLQESRCRVIWQNSSIKALMEETIANTKRRPSTEINKKPENIISLINESGDRLTTVLGGLTRYATMSTKTNETESALNSSNTKNNQTKVKQKVPPHVKKSDLEVKLTASDKALLKRLDMAHREKLKSFGNVEGESSNVKLSGSQTTQFENESSDEQEKPKVKAVPNPKSKQTLSIHAKERSVPSSRIARMASFGGLAAGLGIGTAAEFIRRSVGVGETNSASTMLLTKANMDRIVDTLCKVRGAALKIGQMLSIQDESTVSPELAKALERVRKSADFMPSWQVEEALRTQIDENWRHYLPEFDEKPFAAASIGQVHWGKTTDGQEVAIKIQYPGVAKGIESDIDNLVGIMKVWNIFPKGMFIDNVVTVAKRELAWEVDYKREAECTKKFKELLKPYPEYYVPYVVDKLSSSQVFTTECLEGVPVDQCVDMDLEDRRFIGNKIMELCLLELIEFRFMQTDPNWANFFYNKKTKQVMLLDFGASREYSKEFVDKYIRIIKAASENDRKTILQESRDLGFLTGYESKAMEEAHVDVVMILGEVFRTRGEFNFKGQDTIERIQNLVPTMLTHRLCPPPEEIYSLHRKLSGVFLLCAKLNAPISIRKRFFEMYENYNFD